MACELWLEVVDPARQDRFDNAGVYRLYARVEPGLERTDQMATDLEGCLEPGRQRGGGLVGDDLVKLDALFERGVQRPVNLVALPVAQTAEDQGRFAPEADSDLLPAFGHSRRTSGPPVDPRLLLPSSWRLSAL